MKYVRVTEYFGKNNKYQNEYDGVLVSKTKDEIVIIGVGPDYKDHIQERCFNSKEVKIKSIDKNQVEHFFKLSVLKRENDLNDAEFELLHAKRQLACAKEYFKKHIGKEMSREAVE